MSPAAAAVRDIVTLSSRRQTSGEVEPRGSGGDAVVDGDCAGSADTVGAHDATVRAWSAGTTPCVENHVTFSSTMSQRIT